MLPVQDVAPMLPVQDVAQPTSGSPGESQDDVEALKKARLVTVAAGAVNTPQCAEVLNPSPSRILVLRHRLRLGLRRL